MEIENKINTSIISTIQTFKLKDPYIERKCKDELEYEATSNIVYYQGNVASIFFKGQRIWPM